jgi:hypothetical protein
MDNSLDESYKQGLIYQRALHDSKPADNGDNKLNLFKNMLNTRVINEDTQPNTFLIGDRRTGLVEGYNTGALTLNEMIRKGHSEKSLMKKLYDPRGGERALSPTKVVTFKSKWFDVNKLDDRIKTSEEKDLDQIIIDGRSLSGIIIGKNAIFPNPRYILPTSKAKASPKK